MLFLSTLSKLTMSSLNKTVSLQQEHTGIQIKGAQQVKFQYSCIINLNLHHYALGLGRVSANGCTRVLPLLFCSPALTVSAFK